MTFYFNFSEDTGEIWKITNELDESSPYIEVDAETYREFSTEKKLMKDYVIVPSGNDDLKYEIKLKHKDLLTFDVDRSIHQIPKVTSIDTNNAFVIKQDTKNGKWILSMTPQLRVLLTQTTYYKEKNHLIFITQQDDPNILLDTLDVKLWTVLYEEQFEYVDCDSDVAKRTDVSLYCGKIFDNYIHLLEKE